MDEQHPRQEDLLEFPCDYMFKVFGTNSGEFVEAVRENISSIVPAPLDAVKVRPSREGTYVCVSVLARLHNFEQLKAIYGLLRRVEGLKYLL